MRTLERTAGRLGPTLSTLLRLTRRVTLIVASLALAVTACGPVGVADPISPGADLFDVDDSTAEEAPPDQDDAGASRSNEAATARLEGQAERYRSEPGTRRGSVPPGAPSPEPDCEPAGPMVPC